MFSRCRTIRLAGLWLTALVTLVNAFPHFTYRASGSKNEFSPAPNGFACLVGSDPRTQVAFPGAVFWPTSGPDRPPPGDHESAPRTARPTDEPAVSGAACRWTLDEDPLLISEEDRTDSEADVVAKILPASHSFCRRSAGVLFRDVLSFSAILPPKNRIVLHRHLLI